MERHFLEEARGERLIATGRLLLALFAFVVVSLDPDIAGTQSARLNLVAGVFAIYAIVLAVLAWRAPMTTARGRLALHAIDFLLFSVFIALTHASVSPFFIFFLFSLVTALLRFGVRGMLLTAAAAVLTYVLMATSDAQIRSDPGYLIMRTTSLAVATLLLAYVGTYHERVRDELMKLAAWPRGTTEQRDPLLRETLTFARDLLAAPKALLVWEEEEEPWLYTALLDGDTLVVDRQAPGAVVDGQSALSATFAGQTVSGRIFFPGRDDVHEDDLAVAQIVARLVATRLDQLNVATRMRDAAVAVERLRVARDLHDGLLQSLTGASLQLETTHHLIGTDPAAARDRLRNVQDLIAADQRELRAMITQLRPQTNAPRPTLDTRLAELAERFQRQWDLGVAMTVDPPAPALPELLAAEVYSIINEAVANAARHARASHIEVTLRVDPDDVHIFVADDGTGFPFHGTYTLAELNEQRRGPVTLKERVASVGGDLVLVSTESGSRIGIRLPQGRPAGTLHT